MIEPLEGSAALSMEQIQVALKDRNLREVARQTGLNYDTIWEIARGKRTNPTYENYIALVNYLSKKPHQGDDK